MQCNPCRNNIHNFRSSEKKLEKQHQSNHYTKYFTGWQQLITLSYAQIVGHDTLRGIQTSLGVHAQTWYHLGLTDIKRSTLPKRGAGFRSINDGSIDSPQRHPARQKHEHQHRRDLRHAEDFTGLL